MGYAPINTKQFLKHICKINIRNSRNIVGLGITNITWCGAIAYLSKDGTTVHIVKHKENSPTCNACGAQ